MHQDSLLPHQRGLGADLAEPQTLPAGLYLQLGAGDQVEALAQALRHDAAPGPVDGNCHDTMVGVVVLRVNAAGRPHDHWSAGAVFGLLGLRPYALFTADADGLGPGVASESTASGHVVGWLAVTIWLVGAIGSTGVLLVGLARLRWLRAASTRVTDGPWQRLCADLARSCGLRRGVDLQVAGAESATTGTAPAATERLPESIGGAVGQEPPTEPSSGRIAELVERAAALQEQLQSVLAELQTALADASWWRR